MENKTTSSNRILYIDALRIFAVFFVIFVHTGNAGYSLFVNRIPGSPLYWIDLFLSLFSRFCVASFFAISGALLLGKEETDRKRLRRFGRMVVVLLVISLFYWIEYLVRDNERFSLKFFLRRVYYSEARYHLWFLYAYLAFLMILPFLQALVRHLEDRYYYYLFGLALLFQALLPIMDFLVSVDEYPFNSNLMPVPVLEQIFLYPLLGYFMHHRLSEEKAKQCLKVLWPLNLLALCAAAYLTFYKGLFVLPPAGEAPGWFHFSFVSLNCVTVFLTFRCFVKEDKVAPRLASIIHSMGDAVFGIYLFHMFFLRQPWVEAIYTSLRDVITPMPACVVYLLAILVLSYATTWLLKRIPFVDRYL